MIEIVANRGYAALKVRDVVDYAEVSTRAFYELFAGKEDCFLQTYDLISRRATQRIIAAQAQEDDWRGRVHLVFEQFVRELEESPDSARIALVEAYGAGEESLRQAWRAERTVEAMLAECFARAPSGMAVPLLIVEGVVAGIAGVSRSGLRTGKVAELRGSSEELVEWVLCYLDKAAAELADLDRRSVWRNTVLESLADSLNGEAEPWPSTGDRALILSAAAKLATESGFSALTAPRIRSAATVSRRKFDAYFDGCEDCYLSAIEQHAGEAMAQAARARSAAKSREGGIYRAIAALCEHIAGDPFLAVVCLTDDFPLGPNGARSRRRLIAAVLEFFADTSSATDAPTIVTEASISAVWTLFQHHVVRDRSKHRQVAATLGFLALAPVVGAPVALAAIKGEQRP